MLTLTLVAGQSVLAGGNCEIFFHGVNSDGGPIISLMANYAGSLVHSNDVGAETHEVHPFRLFQLSPKWGDSVRFGEVTATFYKRSRVRLKLGLEAPKEIVFTRPTQHGGSLVRQ